MIIIMLIIVTVIFIVMIILKMALSIIPGMILFIDFKDLRFSNNMNIMIIFMIQLYSWEYVVLSISFQTFLYRHLKLS